MTATVAGIHLGIDTHANRPAANTCPDGSIYSCSTHSLIYKSNFAGNSWATWATLGTAASGSITASGYTQSTARLLGRTTASTGAIEEITVGAGLSLAAGSLTATGGSGGSLVWLQRQTASASATLDFTSFISATYERYLFVLSAILPATNAVNLWMRMGTGGGPTWDAGANYYYSHIGWSGSTGVVSSATGANQILINFPGNTIGNGTTTIPYHGQCSVVGPSSALFKNVENGTDNFREPGGAILTSVYSGRYDSTTAVTGVRFLASSGNLTSGDIDVYGLTHA